MIIIIKAANTKECVSRRMRQEWKLTLRSGIWVKLPLSRLYRRTEPAESTMPLISLELSDTES